MIHESHLELELEIGDGAKSAHDHLRAAPRHVVDEQTFEGVDLDVRLVAEHGAGDLDALVHREERCLFRVDENRDDDAVEQAGAAGDDVDVAVGQRIEGAGIDS